MRYILLTISLILGATAVSAEPSSDISKLMNRSVSLLDWGLYLLEQELKETGNNVYANYSWEENEIVIKTLKEINGDTARSMEEAKRDCDTLFGEYDRKLHIRNGKDILGLCIICDFFANNGYTAPGLEEASKSIKQRVYYVAYGVWHNCRRKLYGTSTSVSQAEHK